MGVILNLIGVSVLFSIGFIVGAWWNYVHTINKQIERKMTKFPILDTTNIKFEVELEKLREESEELVEAADKYNKNEVICIDEVLEEALDVVQVTINILDRLGMIEYIPEALERHIEKLKARGWNFKGIV